MAVHTKDCAKKLFLSLRIIWISAGVCISTSLVPIVSNISAVEEQCGAKVAVNLQEECAMLGVP